MKSCQDRWVGKLDIHPLEVGIKYRTKNIQYRMMIGFGAEGSMEIEPLSVGYWMFIQSAYARVAWNRKRLELYDGHRHGLLDYVINIQHRMMIGYGAKESMKIGH